jgi:hypothetical protein
MAVMEIGYGNTFSFRPSRKASQSPSFLAQSTRRITRGSKVLKKEFNVVGERPLTRRTSQGSCIHVVSPCLAYLPV